MERRDTSLAWRVHGAGAPERVLRLERVAPPRPTDGVVLVRMEAAALNFADVLVCEGTYQERPAPPFVPGFELAGTVVAGAAPAPGTRVLGLTRFPEGAFQQLVALPAAAALPIPDTMPGAEAGALHVAYVTAYLALHRRARLREGETLLVLGAGGAVGSAAVQLGRAAGARVLAATGSAAKAAACRAMGADVVVDAGAGDMAAAVREATGGRGVDVVLDPVGAPLFDAARRCVAFEGRIVVVGFAGGGIPSLPLNRPLLGNYAVSGLYFTPYARRAPDVVAAAHAALLRLYAAGAVRPAIRAEVPFTELPRGFDALRERERPGRVVLLGSC